MLQVGKCGSSGSWLGRVPIHVFPFPLSMVGDIIARSPMGRFEAGEGVGSGAEARFKVGGSRLSRLEARFKVGESRLSRLLAVGSSVCIRISSRLSSEKSILNERAIIRD